MQIEARGVRTGYGRKDVLFDISVSLSPGEVVGLIGPNGSGKTTLLRALSRVLPLRRGTLRYDGRDAASLSAREVARLIAFVPQSEPAEFDFTVRDVVLMGRYAYHTGLSGETREDFEAADQAMAEADVSFLADRAVTTLSGGELRRVLIARALCQQTPVLIMDEPTAHLDLLHQREVLLLARRLARQKRVSTLAALHDLNLAAFCDRLILLREGRVAAEGGPEEILTPPSLETVFGRGVRVTRAVDGGPPVVLPDLSETPARGAA